MGENLIVVNMGQLAVSRQPEDVLAALGLGSCVAVCAYDRVSRVAGMIHVVLPSSQIGRPGEAPARFADQGVQRLLAAVTRQGALRSRLKVAVLGGANVLSSTSDNGLLDIGARNVRGVQEALRMAGLTAEASDVGGKISRTVRLRVDNGEVSVRTLRAGQQLLARLG